MVWRSDDTAVHEAARDPRIAAVLAEGDRVDAAILARDGEGFLRNAAPELVVNHPGNGDFAAAQVGQAMAAGRIDYHSIDRIIDHAAVRPTGEVLLMGGEVVTPRGAAQGAGKTVHRRFTEVWREIDGAWCLSLRQATVFRVEEPGHG